MAAPDCRGHSRICGEFAPGAHTERMRALSEFGSEDEERALLWSFVVPSLGLGPGA